MWPGLQNAPSTFQRFMNHVLREEIAGGHVRVYVDDVILFAADLAIHRYWMDRVFKKFEKYRLCLRLSKCEFEKSEVIFLGMKISHNHLEHDLAKGVAIHNWPRPRNVKDVQKFNGLLNYLQRHIPKLSAQAKPLFRLTGKVPWKWEEEEEAAFQDLCMALVSAPVLALPQDKGRWKVETDASNLATGGVLSQQQEDGTWRVVDYISKALTAAEKNYNVYDKEFLAVIRAMHEWRAYLIGAHETIEIWTDHVNLQYFRKPQKLKPRQVRWVGELQCFDFEIKYRTGKSNTKADALSRRPDYGETVEEDAPVQVFPDAEIRTSFTSEMETLLQKNSAVHVQKPEGLDDEWTRDRVGLWRKGGVTWVPEEVREEVLKFEHDLPGAGHPGPRKLRAALLKSYWWVDMVKDADRYAQGCETCQRTKPDHTKRAAPLHPHSIPDGPWSVISWDIVGPLPLSRGHNAILVIVDKFTKRTIIEGIGMDLTGLGAARILRDRVFRNHGIPHKIVSDRGPQFVSRFMKEFYSMIGVKANPSTAFHPQTDGQTERVNQEIEVYLRAYVDHLQDDWAEWLATAEFALNNREHSATRQTPFFLEYGRHPWNGGIRPPSEVNPAADEWMAMLTESRRAAKEAMEKAAVAMKKSYDATKCPGREYSKGDLVWLDTRNLKMDRPSKKLDNKRAGPFAVEEKVGPAGYRLKLPRAWRIHRVINEVLLTPFLPPSFLSQSPPPPPPATIEDDHLEYEVEAILDVKKVGRGVKYLVKWMGYPVEENTWEPRRNLTNVTLVLQDFFRQHPDKAKLAGRDAQP